MTELRVTGMSCGHCEAAVTAALAAVPGVERVVEVDRKKERAVIEGEADVDALIAAVKGKGYDAERAA